MVSCSALVFVVGACWLSCLTVSPERTFQNVSPPVFSGTNAMFTSHVIFVIYKKAALLITLHLFITERNNVTKTSHEIESRTPVWGAGALDSLGAVEAALPNPRTRRV